MISRIFMVMLLPARRTTGARPSYGARGRSATSPGVRLTGRMRWWDEQVVPRMADVSLRGHEVGAWREEACAPLAGSVLELGFGSGLNVRWYPSTVTRLDAVEPSDVGWSLSQRRRERAQVPVGRVGLDGQALAAADASYDAVLSTFTLCTIPDPALALAEVRRVLRPGGVFCFLEHGLAPTDGVRRWQRRLEPVQRRVAGGCHLTRDVPALVRSAGFEVAVTRTGYLADAPAVGRPWAWLTAGTGR